MNFDYTEEQQLLAESVRRFMARDYTFESRKKTAISQSGISDAVWKTFAEMGLLGLSIPAEHGGFGGGALDLMSTMDAIGEALVVEPFLPTVLGARLVALAGNDAQKAAILPRVSEGSLRLAFASTEEHSRYDLARIATKARRDGDGWVLDGEKRVVLGGPQAGLLVVSARTAGSGNDAAGVSLFVIEPGAAGIARNDYRTFDGLRACDLQLKGVRVKGDALLGAEGTQLAAIEAGVDFAIALLCAEAVGAMRYANETTLEYLKTRKQFGVPIGAFQALQHRMVDMVITCEQARSMASLACARVDAEADPRERSRAASAAKIKIADACRHISQESVQLHGGMGMTEELKVSHTFRRLTMIAQQFGDADHHLARYGR